MCVNPSGPSSTRCIAPQEDPHGRSSNVEYGPGALRKVFRNQGVTETQATRLAGALEAAGVACEPAAAGSAASAGRGAQPKKAGGRGRRGGVATVADGANKRKSVFEMLQGAAKR